MCGARSYKGLNPGTHGYEPTGLPLRYPARGLSRFSNPTSLPRTDPLSQKIIEIAIHKAEFISRYHKDCWH